MEQPPRRSGGFRGGWVGVGRAGAGAEGGGGGPWLRGLDPSLCSADGRSAAASLPAPAQPAGARGDDGMLPGPGGGEAWRGRERPGVRRGWGTTRALPCVLSVAAPHPAVNLFLLLSPQDLKACRADARSPELAAPRLEREGTVALGGGTGPLGRRACLRVQKRPWVGV